MTVATLALISAALSIAICAVTFLLRAKAARRDLAEKRETYAGRAEGVVAGFEPRGTDGLGAPVIEFTAFGERVRRPSEALCARAAFDDGAAVRVLYDEHRPERFLVEEQADMIEREAARHHKLGVTLAVLAIVMLLAALIANIDRFRGLWLQLRFWLRAPRRR